MSVIIFGLSVNKIIIVQKFIISNMKMDIEEKEIWKIENFTRETELIKRLTGLKTITSLLFVSRKSA
jgi:hypothetical protein